MDLRTALSALRKRWWYVALALLVGLGIAVGLTAASSKKYQAAVTFFAGAVATNSQTPLQADQVLTGRILSYVGLLNSDSMGKAILGGKAVDMPLDSLLATIQGSAEANTVIITASVVDTTPTRAMQIAQAIAQTYPGLVDQFGGETGNISMKVLSGPTLTPGTVAPHRTLNYGIGLLAGLMVGAILAFARELTDVSVRSGDELRAVTDLPMLGALAYDRTARRSPLIAGDLPSSRAEAFRQVRTSLRFADVDSPVSVLVVTSAVPAEGKSSTAANLAIVLAESGRRVLLVDADLRRPRVADYLGLDGSIGLSDVVAGLHTLEDAVQTWGDPQIFVLAAGTIPPNPSELLGSHQMSELLRLLRENYDVVIVDTTPVLAVTDSRVLAAQSDGTILVVRSGKTDRHQVARALELLRAVDARILGTVLNGVENSTDAYGTYGSSRLRPTTKLGDARFAAVPAGVHAAAEPPNLGQTEDQVTPDQGQPTDLDQATADASGTRVDRRAGE